MTDTRPGVVVDVDGTMLDTNYLHVVAWTRALRETGHDDVTMEQVHGLIGMESAQLVEELVGHEDEATIDAHSRHYEVFEDDVRALPGAPDLLKACAEHDLGVVIATSGAEKDLEWMLPAIGVDEDILAGTVTSSDVEAAKPAPDLMEAAIAKGNLDPKRSVAFGDTIWDVRAAKRAGLQCIAFTCGGVGEAALREEGAAEVWTDPADLLAHYEESRLSSL